ncbi:kanamycin kinase [Bacillus australimaris]|uniref:Aminoglycoside phosphotransferase family protein n=1 Tax=Bacillus australimaris TaxID=1326968 RepID=A0ABD4QKA0_9BACI|nr:aminoglycoside phosphotransferase family protein [Bacillus australimaris]KPN13416.1 kanamycin kinase [Bacillus australimaris]MBR8690546.1 aminoglycoside phosphotransferase family protein [Bacillus australimaris]
MEHEKLKQLSPFLKPAISFQPMTSGFSRDRTFLVTTSSNEKLVLKLSDIQTYTCFKIKASVQRKLKDQGILCSEVIEIGRSAELNCTYRILSYLEGENARASIQLLTNEEQYEIGSRAGRELSLMHTCHAPSHVRPWGDRVMEKHERYVHAYQSSGVTFSHDQFVLDFIKSHADAVKERPNQFQHDDFHLGNIIIQGNQYAGVIDFDQSDWGDPVHDFYKLSLFSRENSIPFSAGQLDQYESTQSSNNFWLLFSIYTAMSCFSSIVWTLSYDPGHLKDMLNRVERMLIDHNSFHELKPVWYTNWQHS